MAEVRPGEYEAPTGAGAGMARERMPEARREAETEKTSDVLRNIVNSAQEIIRSEIQLAKVEMRQEASKAAKAAGSMAAGGLVMLYGIGFLLACVVWAIALAIPAWASALIVGGFLFIVGAVMLAAGRKKLRQVNPTPQRTVQGLREDARWLREQTR